MEARRLSWHANLKEDQQANGSQQPGVMPVRTLANQRTAKAGPIYRFYRQTLSDEVKP